ncbi:MAG TPA: cell division protein FtsK, partial [Aequorivita sp.]|nr:cell division protein FtsK [Aequorivita sp.]
MAKKKKSTTKTPRKKISFSLSKQQKILLGSFLFLLGLALLFSFVSYFFTWQADQSEIGVLAERELQTKNWLNKFGANVAHFFIYDGFGISAFIFAFLVTLTGIYYFFDYAKKQLTKFWFWGLLLMLWISVFFGFFGEKTTLFSGIIGFETNDLMQDYLGLVGAMLVMIFILIVYLVVRLKLTPEMAIDAFKSSKKQIASEFVSDENKTDHKTSTVNSEIEDEDEEDIPEPFIEEKVSPPPAPPVEKIILKSDVEGDVEMEVEQAADEEEIENLSDKLVKDFGEFDPKLELSNYKFPSIELLRDHTVGAAITIDQEELEENKNRIVETLSNYKIGIANIKATVGPTVTLYEIVPDAGIRISKIKNLEDDIALSLSALGIRIIAPIPGRGTIGIEVPNKNAKIVSMRSVIASAKFQNAEMELPIAFGKTISNETFVVDLAKMPHML